MNQSVEETVKIISAKIGVLLAIGFLSFFCGILPYYSFRAFRSKFPTTTVHKINSAFICFSGGTLLGVTFLHLMPEVRDKIFQLQSEYHFFSFPECLPLSDIIAMSGFFGVYILDELLHMFVEWYSIRMERFKALKSDHKSDVDKVCSRLPREVSVFSLDNFENSVHHVSVCRRNDQLALPVCSSAKYLPDSNQNEATEERELQNVTQESENNESKPNDTTARKCSSAIGTAASAMSPVPGLITIAALSFHDIFEGMAIGIEQNLNSILFLYLSIASHKYAIAFCIGMDLVAAGSRLKMIVLSMMTFSVVSPIGVIVGMMVVAENSRDKYNIDSPIGVVMQGIAGGTLIYVVCFEVLQREGADTHKKGIQNVIFVICGFLVTLGFKILTGHSHSH